MSIETQTWLPIPGWEGLYEVSRHGQVKSLPRHRVSGRILRPSEAGGGYRKVQLIHGGRIEHRYVHDLVLTAFVGPRPAGMEGAHENGKRDDNQLLNLRWDTRPGNHADKIRHGTMCQGESHGRRKLTSDAVRNIRQAAGTCAEIGRQFGVGPMQVSRIKTGKNWGSLT